MRPGARQTGMMSRQQVRRGLAVAAGWGLLGAVLAGCGSVVASTAAGGGASTPARSPGTAAATAASATAAPQVGCASVNQATMVTVSRVDRLVVLPRVPVMVTDRKPAQVRALYRDFCDAVAHPDVPPGTVMNCPADFGTDYAGVFYDGNVVLARFIYAPTGCAEVSLIVGSAEHTTMLAGRAATAAPHLTADFATVLDSAKTGGAS
jgi:hypothetical protein